MSIKLLESNAKGVTSSTFDIEIYSTTLIKIAELCEDFLTNNGNTDKKSTGLVESIVREISSISGGKN